MLKSISKQSGQSGLLLHSAHIALSVCLSVRYICELCKTSRDVEVETDR